MKTLLLSAGNIQLVDMLLSSPESVADYFRRNKTHLEPSMPEREEAFYSHEFWRVQFAAYKALRVQGGALRYVLLDGAKVVGQIGFDQIIRGPFQACYLGYSMDVDYQGRGLMKEALRGALEYVTGEFGLHRVMANYEPDNVRSARLLKSLGFEREGYARKYLKLNGVWKDHILTSYLAERA
ncbi:GNAT family N-acetyltransferase [Ectopseudomonas mendocina]|uniref:GNAT family N-acetyltransferase n=1 Tax=Ectopseudomonas mendocina TaxID=300 RepID=A0ABZ2RI96_ECTME